MTFHPSIIALFVASAIIAALVLYSSWHGLMIAHKWNISSGSELQLILERKTYLISMILTYVLGFKLATLFLFIYTADSIHTLFTGAMCAAGTLNVNAFGYPALMLKIVTFLVSGIWLIINHADTQAYDYPILRKKYALLGLITPLILLEAFLEGKYFLGLKADIITSCCGSLFSSEGRTFSSELASIPLVPARTAFYGIMTLLSACGIFYCFKQKGAYLFAVLSLAGLVVSLGAIISFISLYYYELPTHHCPFCLLQSDYGYIGYPLYAALMAGATAGGGVGALQPFRNIPSLKSALPGLQRKLAILSLTSYLLFTLLVTLRMLTTDFRLV